MNPLFFIFDLDETLLTSDKELTPFTVEAINKLKRIGHRVTLASGRAFELMKPYAEMLDIKEPLVANNGGSIQRLDGEVLFEAFVEESAQKAVIENALKHNFPLVQYTNQGFVGNESERMDFYRAWNQEHVNSPIKTTVVDTVEAMMAVPAYKLLTVIDDLKTFNNTQADYQATLDAHVTKSQNTFLDVLPKNTNKGSGVIKLLEMLAIEPQQVIVFGDNDNDAEMLNLFTTSYAMKNGTDKAKAAARFVTIDDNNNDGVAKTLIHALNL